MWNKLTISTIILFWVMQFSNAQNCNLSIQGKVLDEGTNTPLEYVNILIQELSTGEVTKEDGEFSFQNICPNHYHLIVSHIGCVTQKIHIDLSRDTTLIIKLPHSETSLHTITIEGKKESINHPTQSIDRQTIEDNSNENLSGVLKKEAGVYLLKNGSGISKPVLHGLYGNRLTILNNGIVQSGQQWGNDHSPEIDPNAADKIRILKGSNALEYSGGNLGGVIMIEPKRIQKEPHLHGQINYSYESNGRGHNTNFRLQKFSPLWAWKITGSMRNYGDRKTSSYFLNNTGVREYNFSLQIEKSWNDKLFLDIYASSFNTVLGVLRGSHIGNTTDLEEALQRDIPFFTEENYSRSVDAPKQKVSHHLAKAKLKYFIKDTQYLELTLAGQINDRKEFDVRRGDRTDIPVLDLQQYTFNSEIKYSNTLQNGWIFKAGLQNIITDNTNIPGTGILPLIPDYLSYKNGVFSTLAINKDKLFFNLGIRYDYEYQSVATITGTFPNEIVKYKNNFQNLTGLISSKYKISNAQSISLNTGYASRNPGINELYSNGLHQGVSGIEEGDINLNRENAIKTTLEYEWLPNSNFSFNILGYVQYIDNYIFLNPQDEVRLTIRGAFPVFKYEQTDATISGIDFSTNFTLNKSFIGSFKYSHIHGKDTENDLPLIFIPPNKIFGSLTYRHNSKVRLTNALALEETELEIDNSYVFEQTNILADQDFVYPPPSYNLVGIKLSTNIISPNYKLRTFVKVSNLFNIAYRDYLNRQRYFADDLGRSLVLGLSFKF